MSDHQQHRSHHIEGGFRNIHGRKTPRLGFPLGWLINRKPAPWPRRVNTPYAPPQRAAADDIAVTFINHSTFLLQIGGIVLLTDPIWARRPSPIPLVGPRRIRPPGHRITALPRPDILLISHCHYDHLDLPSLRRVKRHAGPKVVTPLGNRSLLAHAGLRRVAELDWWQSAETDGLTITCVPAVHFSARTPFDRNRRLWGGFVVESAGRSVYFAGDTADGTHFAEIRARFPSIDLALLPIGAYAPREIMRAVHVDPHEAVAAHVAVGARRSIGMHFGTFAGLTDEAIDEPAASLAEAVRAAGLAPDAFTTLDFGETRVFAPAPALREPVPA